MRLFTFPLLLCTYLTAQPTSVPLHGAVVLVNNETGGNDHLLFIAPVTHATTAHTLPWVNCSALGLLSANEMLAADDAGAGSNIYSIPIVNGAPDTPVYRTFVPQRIQRMCRLDNGTMALMAADRVYAFAPDAESPPLQLFTVASMTLVDIATTLSGFLVLGNTTLGAYLAWFDMNGALLYASTHPAIQLPLSLKVVDATTLQVGSATAGGTIYEIDLSSGESNGGGTVTPVSQGGPPATKLVNDDVVQYAGRARDVTITAPDSPSGMVTIQLSGLFLDLVLRTN